jgi:hypothetical protein
MQTAKENSAAFEMIKTERRPLGTGAASARRSRSERLTFSFLLLVPLAFVEFILFGVYWVCATFATSCAGPNAMFAVAYVRGGQPESVPTAAGVGGSLWLAAGVAMWRFPRRRKRVFASATVLYGVVLGLLWAITPAVWGAGVCPR